MSHQGPRLDPAGEQRGAPPALGSPTWGPHSCMWPHGSTGTVPTGGFTPWSQCPHPTDPLAQSTSHEKQQEEGRLFQVSWDQAHRPCTFSTDSGFGGFAQKARQESPPVEGHRSWGGCITPCAQGCHKGAMLMKSKFLNWQENVVHTSLIRAGSEGKAPGWAP